MASPCLLEWKFKIHFIMLRDVISFMTGMSCRLQQNSAVVTKEVILQKITANSFNLDYYQNTLEIQRLPVKRLMNRNQRAFSQRDFLKILRRSIPNPFFIHRILDFEQLLDPAQILFPRSFIYQVLTEGSILF